MKLIKAQETVKNLKDILTDKYWSDIYYTIQNESLPQEEREYDVYIEYNGEFDLNKMNMLITLFPTYTFTLALQTRQIIIW